MLLFNDHLAFFVLSTRLLILDILLIHLVNILFMSINNYVHLVIATILIYVYNFLMTQYKVNRRIFPCLTVNQQYSSSSLIFFHSSIDIYSYFPWEFIRWVVINFYKRVVLFLFWNRNISFWLCVENSKL